MNERVAAAVAEVGQVCRKLVGPPSGGPHRLSYDAEERARLNAVSLAVPDPARTREHDVAWRKQRPVFSGVLKYFPDALLEVAYCSWTGNEQHHAGEPLHWDRSKSTDEADALTRHLLHAGEIDSDGVRHSAKVAWRALALLQKEIERERSREAANHALGGGSV